jgi:hypothetical protein
MQNEDLKGQMEVYVEYGGCMRAAKVLGPVGIKEVGTGRLLDIEGWRVAIEPSGLLETVSADKIHARD